VSPVPADRPISLSEAIAIALEGQPQLALARFGVEAAGGRVRQARSGYYPSVSISAQHTRTGPEAGGVGAVGGTFTAGGYSTDLTGRQLLYDFGKTPASVGQARGQEESARQALAQVRQQTINQVKQAYYLLLQDQQLVGVQERNVAEQRAHLGMARARYEAGAAARADVVRAEAAVGEAILTLTTAQNAAAVARVNLNLAMGVDVRTPTQVEETEEGGSADLRSALRDPASLVQRALANRAEVKQAESDLEVAKAALRLARASNRPALSANGNYGLRGSSFPPTDESWSYGLSLQWPLGDVGLTRGNIEESEANVLAAQARLRQVEQSVSSEVVQAWLNVATAEQRVAASEQEVASAEESLRLAEGRYEAGVASYVEVIDAETAAVTARTNLVNARYGASIALASLELALGMGEGE
jgi:TolC family type I secretion outer membrane protein